VAAVTAFNITRGSAVVRPVGDERPLPSVPFEPFANEPLSPTVHPTDSTENSP
jgi:hypothetical protein